MTTSPFDADRPPAPPRREGRRRRAESGVRRRGGDPNATVPEAHVRAYEDATSYYGRNVVHPAPWGHEIPAYLFLGGLAAGAGLLGAGGHFTGRERLRRRSRVSAIIAVALGSGALVKDLGRPERALNMMRTAKLTSPMSVGSWILAGFGTCASAALGTEMARALLPRDGWLGRLLSWIDPLASVGSAFFAPPLAAYTGVLLADTATPSWHAAYKQLPFVFVSSATAAGCGLALVTTPTEETGPARQLAVLGAATDVALTEAMLHSMGDLAEPYHQGKARRWLTAAKGLTVGGALGAALLGGRRAPAVASGLALLAGSVCTRFGVFEAGMASAKDPRYTVGPQRARAGHAAAEGRSVTQPSAHLDHGGPPREELSDDGGTGDLAGQE